MSTSTAAKTEVTSIPFEADDVEQKDEGPSDQFSFASQVLSIFFEIIWRTAKSHTEKQKQKNENT